MRFGLLGPALEHSGLLRDAARYLRDELGAERVVYLGPDQAMDGVIRDWAEELVGPSADDMNLMRRAARECLFADAEEILLFVERERERSALRMFESLPGASTRSVELIGGKVAVLIYDKAHLVEDDILPASLLLYGRSREPLMKQVGRRWFISPGAFPKFGLLVLDDADGTLTATSYTSTFDVHETRVLEAPRSLRMRVTGGA